VSRIINHEEALGEAFHAQDVVFLGEERVHRDLIGSRERSPPEENALGAQLSHVGVRLRREIVLVIQRLRGKEKD
jgi:hypothetical protein